MRAGTVASRGWNPSSESSPQDQPPEMIRQGSILTLFQPNASVASLQSHSANTTREPRNHSTGNATPAPQQSSQPRQFDPIDPFSTKSPPTPSWLREVISVHYNSVVGIDRPHGDVVGVTTDRAPLDSTAWIASNQPTPADFVGGGDCQSEGCPRPMTDQPNRETTEPTPQQEGFGPSLDKVHVPVLPQAVLEALPGGEVILLDGTVGAGGHATLLARRLTGRGRVIGLDRDPAMLELAARATHGLPVELVHASYTEAREVLAARGLTAIDGLLLDLGLSSDQLAWTHRGFSFQNDGPLDMRFDTTQGETAADLVAHLDAEQLADLFYRYGEERFSRRVARRIVEERRLAPILTTQRLATIVRHAIPGRRGPIDPATRVFQALRIAVNRELEHLEEFLGGMAELLKPGGRAAVISFHSLEDRKVKHAFRNDPRWTVITKKPIVATPEEVAANPRARSAKLRVAQR